MENVSLLPQPAVPAPIEAMRGGGFAGGGTENVSLLPQPAVAAPIEPMRGGGPENVSLLPQPTIPVPIEPMRGGVKVPIINLATYQQPLLDKLRDPEWVDEQKIGLRKPFLQKYTKYREGHPWKKEQMPKDPNDNKIPMPYSFPMDESRHLYVFYVYDFKHFLQVSYKVEKILRTTQSKHKEMIPVFIFIDNTTNKEEFDDVYRNFIDLVTQINTKFTDKEIDYKDYELYFLFDKTKKKEKQIIWLSDESKAREVFYYLEPDSICITYTFGTEEKGLCFIPIMGINKDLVKYAAITSEDATKIMFQTSGKDGSRKKFKKANELMAGTSYSVDEERNKDFWRTKYLTINLSGELPDEVPDDEEEEEGEGENATGTGETTNTTTTTTAAAAAVATPPPPQTSKQLFTIKGKPTISVHLSGQDFEVRKPTAAVEDDWGKSIFSIDEQKLFESIGVTEEFRKEKGYETQRKIIYETRGDLLRSLAYTECLNDTTYLLKSECEFMRDYLQTLLEIRQFDRLRSATSLISQIQDFDISLQMTPGGPRGPGSPG
jgi:hypothetical protein